MFVGSLNYCPFMISGQSCNVCFIKIQTTVHTYTVIVTVLWLFLANSNFILQISHDKTFKILSKDIHNYILCVVRIFMKQTLLWFECAIL